MKNFLVAIKTETTFCKFIKAENEEIARRIANSFKIEEMKEGKEKFTKKYTRITDTDKFVGIYRGVKKYDN